MDCVVRRAPITGVFRGFDKDALFCLADNSNWLQAEYKYWYHYAYRPIVEIYQDGGRVLLRLAGQSTSVQVRQIGQVITSRIADAFEGWQGGSEYHLTNGQVWKQRTYRYEYR